MAGWTGCHFHLVKQGGFRRRAIRFGTGAEDLRTKRGRPAESIPSSQSLRRYPGGSRRIETASEGPGSDMRLRRSRWREGHSATTASPSDERPYGTSGLKLGSRKQLTTPNTTSYQAGMEKGDSLPDRQCYTAQRNESSSPLNHVDNAVEDYELFPRPWFETAGTIHQGIEGSKTAEQ